MLALFRLNMILKKEAAANGYYTELLSRKPIWRHTRLSRRASVQRRATDETPAMMPCGAHAKHDATASSVLAIRYGLGSAS